ncbi:hypothetical protein B0J12DRAFT_329082 [Macrophomina phaseolina]|uniref:Uncharacterized protein n=1 Tax=Macrophomina phaseolina TaxID=35725 RepID=A0ABQ8FXU4_9PEZI|nr:hypothetical protein B0J12DRAFT_329082 [Macrophomina phaseolina]
MARSFSGQTKRETIQKKYGLTDHQWDLFLTHTHDEAKELFFTNKYWTGTKKPDDVKWIDLDEGIMKRFIKEVNERLVKSQVKVDYPLMKWRLLPLIRRKPNYWMGKRMTERQSRLSLLKTHQSLPKTHQSVLKAHQSLLKTHQSQPIPGSPSIPSPMLEGEKPVDVGWYTRGILYQFGQGLTARIH